MTVLAQSTGPVKVSIRDANGVELMTYDEVEACALLWIQEGDMLRLERELENVRTIVLFGYTIGTYPVFF